MFDNEKYTSKDISAIREELIEFIKEYNPDCTDFNMSSIQLQYTDILAGVADMLCYYLDNQALETFLGTARQAKNIKNILATMNYKIDPIGTAKGTVTIERQLREQGMKHDEPDTCETGRIRVPKFTEIFANDASVPSYVTLDEVLLLDDMINAKVPIAQGKLMEIDVPVSTIKDSFRLYLTESAVPIEFVSIVDDTWEKVEDAFVEVKGGKKYSVHTDSKDMVYILFTYNWTKYLSNEAGATMKIRYLVSLGSSGVIDSFVLDRIDSGALDIDTGEECSGRLKVYNTQATYGAFDTINLNIQKANAKNYLKTYDRIILLEDLQTMVLKESWVRACVSYDWRRNSSVVKYPHQMKCWVVTVDGADVNASQLVELTNKMQELTVCMTTVEVLSAEFYNLDLEVTIEVEGSNLSAKESIRSRVEEMLNRKYSLKYFLQSDIMSKLDFGIELRPSVIEGECYSASAAIYNVTTNLESTIGLKETQFLNIGTVKVSLK